VLVVTQFGIAIVLLVGLAVVERQLGYVRSARLGFEPAQRVVLPAPPGLGDRFDAVRRQLLAHPGVLAATASEYVPSEQLANAINVEAEVGGQMRAAEALALLAVDHDFAAVYGLEVVAGRAFSKDVATDSTQAVLLNETAVRQLGWPSAEAAVGRAFVLNGNTLQRRGQVVGVVRDFHFESLHERIPPLVLYIRPEQYGNVTVKIAAQDVAGTLAFLEAQWQRLRPQYPFTYDFVDQAFAALYQAEERLGRLFSGFAVLALFIACLGLFGLAAFTAEQRTKEIGIRKVLGASAGGLVLLLTKEFARLVAVAFVVAVPIAYLAMDRWLDTFAYRAALGPGVFVAAGLVALAVALGTVSYQALRAALSDPVKALRYE
jgi:putative ABC transport system permease protein